MKEVGERIKKRREELGLTKTEVADRIGVARTTLMRWERGDIGKVPLTVLYPLADTLETTPAWLMGWEPDMDEEMADIFGKLDPADRAVILNLAKDLLKRSEER